MANPVADFFSPGKDCNEKATRCGKHALGSTATVIDLMSTLTCSVDGVLKDSIKDMVTAAHNTTGYQNPDNVYVTSVIRQSTDGADAAYIEDAQLSGALARDMKDDILSLKSCLELVNDDNLANGVYAAVQAGKLTSRGPVTSVQQVKNEMASTCVLKAVSNSLCTMGLAREVENDDDETKIPDSTISPTPHNSDGIITKAPTPPTPPTPPRTATPSANNFTCRKTQRGPGKQPEYSCYQDPHGEFSTAKDCNDKCGKS